MKVTHSLDPINPAAVLNVGVDVSKDKLNVHFELRQGRAVTAYDDEFGNRTSTIEHKLDGIAQLAMEHGYTQTRVICEPTSGYETKLLKTARRQGLLTNYVNGEAVAKFRVVETNDSGKTDLKDPCTITTLAGVGKILTHRVLPDSYATLRALNRIHHQVDKDMIRLRCRMHRLLLQLFPDYSFKKDFIYSNSGRALVRKYGADPYRIVEVGFKRFSRAMRTRVKGIRKATLARLFDDACCSARNEQPAAVIDVLISRLEQLYDDYERLAQRKQQLRDQMSKIYLAMRDDDPRLPPPVAGVINVFNLARILAETGPLHDFANHRKLLRFAGLNIREKQSGQYKGQNRVSKKGSSMLRNALDKAVLPLVTKTSLYGPFYHHKKTTMPGNKAMVVVMRKFLKMLFGWYRSGEDFNAERVFTSASSFDAAA